MAEHEHIDAVRHSLAHLLAAAVLEVYPEAKIAIGPTIENGFYYDIQFPEGAEVSDDMLPDLEGRMRTLIKQNLAFSGSQLNLTKAKKLFKGNPFKEELIADLGKTGEDISVYKTGDIFTDLCRGGHVENTSEIDPDGFKLTHIAGAYWRGDEKNPMLTRIYGVAFDSKQELEEYLERMKEAEARDHRKLGKELDLFRFTETVGKGLPLWTAKGAVLKRELENFIIEEEIKRGYLHVSTPDIAKLDLYRKSGHYPYYKDSMYAPIEIDDEEFMLRPMTCPHHFELYNSTPHTYKELPMRIAEIAKLYRYEQSGELSGLIRVRSFCLADSHIICADGKQAQEEINGALDLIEYVTGVFGLELDKDYSYRLSLGDRSNKEKYYDNDAAWEEGETLLRELLQKRGSNFVEAEDEAAFYGPKIDIQMKNVRGKEDTAFTVQYDFCMPTRFNLTYIDSHGEEQEPVVVHRSSIGAIERTIALLIEHFAGAFPTWLAPVQVVILPVSDKFISYAESVRQVLQQERVRTELPEVDETLGKRIRSAELQKVPYILVVGEKEASDNTVNVRTRHQKDTTTEPLDDFVKRIKEEIVTRALSPQ